MLTTLRLVPITLALLLSACIALPNETARNACNLLQTAAAEARACYASARDGYRDRAECDAL